MQTQVVVSKLSRQPGKQPGSQRFRGEYQTPVEQKAEVSTVSQIWHKLSRSSFNICIARPTAERPIRSPELDRKIELYTSSTYRPHLPRHDQTAANHRGSILSREHRYGDFFQTHSDTEHDSTSDQLAPVLS